jgi:hypothetical protein
VTGWRGIFGAFILFSSVSMVWFMLRLPETLPAAKRSPFRVAPLAAALREVLGTRVVQLSILMQAMLFAALFGTLSQIQFAVRPDLWPGRQLSAVVRHDRAGRRVGQLSQRATGAAPGHAAADPAGAGGAGRRLGD